MFNKNAFHGSVGFAPCRSRIPDPAMGNLTNDGGESWRQHVPDWLFHPHKSTHNRTSPLETETSGNTHIDYYGRPKSVINKSSNVVSH